MFGSFGSLLSLRDQNDVCADRNLLNLHHDKKNSYISGRGKCRTAPVIDFYDSCSRPGRSLVQLSFKGKLYGEYDGVSGEIVSLAISAFLV